MQLAGIGPEKPALTSVKERKTLPIPLFADQRIW